MPGLSGPGTLSLKKERKMATEETGETIATIGHNSNSEDEKKPLAVERLRSIVERIERLDEEKKALAGDIRDIYLEAKSGGFDVKVLRQLIALRRKEPAVIEEQETTLDTYRRALGM